MGITIAGNPTSVTYGGGADIEVVPTVTATSIYANGNVMGGIMTFTNVLSPTNTGLLENATIKFKGSLQTSTLNVGIFIASPTGTFTDHANAVIASTDSAFLVDILQFSLAQSLFGTHTIYTLDGIARQIGSNTGNLYCVVQTPLGTTVNCASTSDMSLRLGVIW